MTDNDIKCRKSSKIEIYLSSMIRDSEENVAKYFFYRAMAQEYGLGYVGP